MRDVAVHYVADPALDLAGDLSGLALGAHGDVDVLAAVVDLRHGADEVLGMLAYCFRSCAHQDSSTYSSTGGERLEDAALGISFDDLVDGVLALSNFQLVTQALANNVQTAATSHTVKNQLVVKRSSDEFLLAVLALPHNEEVGGTGLGTLTLSAVQPQDLVVAAKTSIRSSHERRTVIGADLGVSETTNPSADHVLGRSVQAHTTGRSIHARHESDDDVEKGLLGSLNTELALGANQGRTDVQEVAGLVAGQPLGAINRQQRNHQLLNLGRREDRQRDTAGRHAEALHVAAGAEDAQLAIVATVDLEALETLGSVVQTRSGRHEAQWAVGLELGSGPALSGRPGGGHHVVGGDGLEAGVGGGFIGDGTRVLGEGDGELGGVEVVLGRSLGAIGVFALDGGSGQVDILLGNGGGRHCRLLPLRSFVNGEV